MSTKTQSIVLVDDVSANNKLLAGYLQSLPDISTNDFTDSIRAMEWCIEYEPDLIIVDYMMPEMDGLEFIRQARSKARLRDTPVIMVTDETKKAVLYEALKFGSTDFLRKPVDHIELLARVRNLLDLRRQQRELKVASATFFRLATTDSLTGVANRRHFLAEVQSAMDHADRRDAAMCIGILDLDRFKSVNDTYGHDAGDRVLKEFTRLARSCIRETDILGRMGGEEFGLFMPHTDISDAAVVANRILKVLRNSPIAIGQTSLRVSTSIGLAQRRANSETLDFWLRRGDRALYAAKDHGRDRCVTDADLEPESAQPPESVDLEAC